MNDRRQFSFQFRNFILILSLLFTGILSGCEFQLDIRELVDQIVEQIVPPPPTSRTPTSPALTIEATEAVVETPVATPLSGAVELVLWVPPQFDPQLDNPASQIFKQRIADFEATHDEVFISVRVKAVSGPTGLLEALTITSGAATQAMPSLIALQRSDLETAVSRNLLVPFDAYSSMIDGQDWYDYARRLTVVGGNSYGLPFAGDALTMVYRPSVVGQSPGNWNDLIRRGEPIAFPAADPQSLIALNLYLSLGGELESAQRLPQMDLELFTRLYQLFADGAQSGVFPLWLTELQRDSDTWTSYNDLRSNWVITWASRYLADPSEDSTMAIFPSLNDSSVTLSDGWVWCLTDPRVQAHDLSVDLAEFLTEADYLARWAPVKGVLPVRPTSLTKWDGQSIQTLLGQIATSARIRPNNEIINTIGLVMEDQLVLILSGRTTAPFAAQAVIDRIGNP